MADRPHPGLDRRRIEVASFRFHNPEIARMALIAKDLDAVMADRPQFGSIPVQGSATLSATADSSYTAPTNTVTLLSGQGPRQVTDAVSNSTTLVTSATANFNSGDKGRPVSGSGIPNGTIIADVASATNVHLSQAASTSVNPLTLIMGGGVGTLVTEVDAIGTGTTVLGIIELYLLDSAYDVPDSAATYHVYDSIPVVAVTPSTTIPPFRYSKTYSNLWLPPRWSLVATSFVSSQLINMVASGLNA